MEKSQLFKELQNRLISLLKDSAIAEARLNRITQNRGSIEDAIAVYNFAVSQDILHLDASSARGIINPEILSRFRTSLARYMEENGPANPGYKTYISIICEYLAMVVQKPLHPPYIRHFKNNPPEDEDRAARWYCAFRTESTKAPYALCKFCNSIPWPDKPAETAADVMCYFVLPRL